MFVYVKNHDGAALMPCKPAKARKLLQAGKAKIVDYRPFTIQLCWQCEGHVQEPFKARPQDCQILERGGIILWKQVL